MSEQMPSPLRQRIHTTHQWFLEVTEPLTEDQLRWIPSATAPPIRWHIWHIARCADMGAARISSAFSSSSKQFEIWHGEHLRERWELPPPDQLGGDEMGANMEDQLAATLPLPEKPILLDYCRRAFQTLEQEVEQFPPEQFDNLMKEVVFQLSHTSRHLGMIEALRGLQGLHGTATI